MMSGHLGLLRQSQDLNASIHAPPFGGLIGCYRLTPAISLSNQALRTDSKAFH
jgi:hypothetical protein